MPRAGKASSRPVKAVAGKPARSGRPAPKPAKASAPKRATAKAGAKPAIVKTPSKRTPAKASAKAAKHAPTKALTCPFAGRAGQRSESSVVKGAGETGWKAETVHIRYTVEGL